MTKGKLIKALLMNTLVFPGSGYFTIGRKLRGFVLCGLVTLLLFMLFFHLFFLVFSFMQTNPIIVGNIQDILNASQGLSQQVLEAHNDIIRIYLYLFLFCYVFGIGDVAVLFWLETSGEDQGHH